MDLAITGARPFPGGFPALLGVAPVAYGSWWVTNGSEEGEPPRVRRIDPETLEITAVIELGGEPGGFPPDAYGADISANGIWVPLGYQKAVVLVDPNTNGVTQRIEINANPYRVLEDGNHLWITDFENSEVLRVDIPSGEEELRIAIPDPSGIVMGPEGLWVIEHRAGYVTRLDPSTGEQLARVEVGGRPGITLGLGSVWAGSDDEKQMLRIDPSTNRVVATIALPANGSSGLIADGALWVTVSPQRGACELTSYLVRIDPASNAIDGLLQLPCVAFVAPDGDRLRISSQEGDVLSISYLGTSP